jgi:L-galactose dehydrogenase
MQTALLGRTGLDVSVAGLGCGGHSRLGMSRGGSEDEAADIVRHALSLGINFIDTARVYGTESAVGKGIQGQRDKIVISTKAGVGWGDHHSGSSDVVTSLETSLRSLNTDYIDVFSLHGVVLSQYDWIRQEILPQLRLQQQAGKIRYLGITEHFGDDSSHEMLKRALPDDQFDVVMVGFNLLNPSARHSVFPLTHQNNVATQIMFAVRRALSQPEALRTLIGELVAAGALNDDDLNTDDPLGFVENHPDISSIVQAAYRFCRHEPGATVTLTGTGSKQHLTDNVAAILAPPLPTEVSEQLDQLFGKIDSVSGN